MITLKLLYIDAIDMLVQTYLYHPIFVFTFKAKTVERRKQQISAFFSFFLNLVGEGLHMFSIYEDSQLIGCFFLKDRDKRFSIKEKIRAGFFRLVLKIGVSNYFRLYKVMTFWDQKNNTSDHSILFLTIKPAMRRLGFGREALLFIINRMSGSFTITTQDTKSIQFLTSCGFSRKETCELFEGIINWTFQYKRCLS